LCIPCHKKTETFGWQKMWKSRIARERIALVEAQPNLFEPRAEQLELPRTVGVA